MRKKKKKKTTLIHPELAGHRERVSERAGPPTATSWQSFVLPHANARPVLAHTTRILPRSPAVSHSSTVLLMFRRRRGSKILLLLSYYTRTVFCQRRAHFAVAPFESVSVNVWLSVWWWQRGREIRMYYVNNGRIRREQKPTRDDVVPSEKTEIRWRGRKERLEKRKLSLFWHDPIDNIRCIAAVSVRDEKYIFNLLLKLFPTGYAVSPPPHNPPPWPPADLP